MINCFYFLKPLSILTIILHIYIFSDVNCADGSHMNVKDKDKKENKIEFKVLNESAELQTYEKSQYANHWQPSFHQITPIGEDEKLKHSDRTIENKNCSLNSKRDSFLKESNLRFNIKSMRKKSDYDKSIEGIPSEGQKENKKNISYFNKSIHEDLNCLFKIKLKILNNGRLKHYGIIRENTKNLIINLIKIHSLNFIKMEIFELKKCDDVKNLGYCNFYFWMVFNRFYKINLELDLMPKSDYLTEEKFKDEDLKYIIFFSGIKKSKKNLIKLKEAMKKDLKLAIIFKNMLYTCDFCQSYTYISIF